MVTGDKMPGDTEIGNDARVTLNESETRLETVQKQ